MQVKKICLAKFKRFFFQLSITVQFYQRHFFPRLSTTLTPPSCERNHIHTPEPALFRGGLDDRVGKGVKSTPRAESLS